MALNITRLFFRSLIWCPIFICLSSGFVVPPPGSSMWNQKESVFPLEAEQLFEMFLQWTKKHGRIYPNTEETEARYQIFQTNLKYITEINAKKSKSPSGYRLGLNKFADLSPEEFRHLYLRPQKIPTTTTTTPPAVATATANTSSLDCTPPASMDWRNQGAVTSVKDQGSTCGCCWAFAAAGAIESINAITTGKLISLSEQELLDCDSVSQGCDYGWSYGAFEWVINNGGISEEADYPYVAQKGSCKANMQNGDRVVKISSYTQLAQSDDALLCATAKQPIAVSLYVTDDFRHYESGIYDGANCPKDSTNTNHIALIVGYDSEDGKDYWIVKNSWGKDWGKNGYFLMQRNTDLSYGVCSINAWGYFPNID